jgi:hypothetical protein
MEIALKDDKVQKRLFAANSSPTAKFLNYVLPAEWFIPDIPMKDVQGIGEHYTPDAYDTDRYKILFMHAVLQPDAASSDGIELIIHTVRRIPIIEVEVSLEQNKVIHRENPPATVVWGDIPTPLF